MPTNSYAFVIMDNDLGQCKMLGSTATQLIKEFDPRIPVYGFTVHDDAKTSTEFINAGIRRVFIKPLKEDDVKLVRYGNNERERGCVCSTYMIVSGL